MAAARSINAACFAAATAALFSFNLASLARRLAFSTERRWMSNAHSALVIPSGRSLSVRTTLFLGAGLAARASAADMRGATYFLGGMVGRWSKAKACVGGNGGNWR